MSASWAPTLLPTQQLFIAQGTCNLAQGVGTYDVLTVSGGDVLIDKVIAYVSTAAVGLVTDAIATNNTTPDVILAALAAASITAGKNLTPVISPIYLPSTKKIQHTIVGTGSAGVINIVVFYYKLSATSLLS